MKNFNILVLFVAVAMLVLSPSLGVHAMEMTGTMTHKLTNTNVPVTIPLTKGYVKGSEVFYISTEASDKDLANDLTKLTGFRVAFTPALQKTPADALAQIYAFKNGIKGPGPLGFQPNVADSQPGDPNYSPLWAVNVVEWKDGILPRELKSQSEILAAQKNDELTVTASGLTVNCPFVQWNGGGLKVRADKTLDDLTPYGGGQVLNIDIKNLQVTFVAHRGFAPDGSTIYYIATDASKKDVADMLGVSYVPRTDATLLSPAASDLYVFTNGIEGSGPMGFQASIGSTNVGDEFYSPLWRIQGVTWKDTSYVDFLTTTKQISTAGTQGYLSTEVAGVIVNCPFVPVDEKFMMDDSMIQDKMMDDNMKDEKMMEKESTMMKMEHMDSPRKQMRSGVAASDVQCSEGLEHIIKVADGSAKCVTTMTAAKLIAIGWATQ